MLRSLASLVALFLAISPLLAQSPRPDFTQAVELLSGEWVAEGGGAPAQAAGGFSFQPDLQGKVLVRRNWADYPATKDKPAYHHEDLMIVYDPTEDQPLRALYLDSEGHAIEYTAELAKKGGAIRFTSSASGAGPRFRLSYRKGEGGRTLAGTLETAPPGQPEAFTTYLHWTARPK